MKSPAFPVIILAVSIYILARSLIQLTLFVYYQVFQPFAKAILSQLGPTSIPLTTKVKSNYHLPKGGFSPKPKQQKPTKARKSKAGDRICE